MIAATGTHCENVMRLEILYPGKTEIEIRYIIGDSLEDRLNKGWELIYKLNKNRVLEPLYKWVKQRRFQLDSYSPARAKAAHDLVRLLDFFSDFHYLKICKVVAEHRSHFEYIAPGSKSCFREYYEKNIIPILNECDVMKDEIKK